MAKNLTVKQIDKYVFKEEANRAFSVKPGDALSFGRHRLFVHDLEKVDIAHMASLIGTPVDLLYVDPPWGAANASTFRGKANQDKSDYPAFTRRLCELISRLSPRTLVLEMGLKWVDDWQVVMEEHGIHVAHLVKGVYYGSKPMVYMIAGEGADEIAKALEGVDDHYSPGIVINLLPNHEHVVDPCCGRATTGYYALRAGRRFTGNELGPFRANGAAYHIQRLMEEGQEGAGI